MSVYVIPKTITAMYINTDYISQPIVGRFDKRVKSSHACEGLIATVRNLVDGNGCSNVVKNVQWRCMIYQRQSQPCTLTRTTFSHPKTPVDIQSPTSLHVPSTPPPRLMKLNSPLCVSSTSPPRPLHVSSLERITISAHNNVQWARSMGLQFKS